ncbi:hypothetical protein SKAU_G00146090 [Synaphobranchus kaupii]|uniref:Uncharacterized protein n=1 Tax=Synaphobranchus kaupii TaxID=118154 RepID=A0A9Q1J4R4_SYNKA|nr:hypothetical protein SKAU_G00146090 [Synaphobranchus kaupii]
MAREVCECKSLARCSDGDRQARFNDQGAARFCLIEHIRRCVPLDLSARPEDDRKVRPCPRRTRRLSRCYGLAFPLAFPVATLGPCGHFTSSSPQSIKLWESQAMPSPQNGIQSGSHDNSGITVLSPDSF